MISLLLILAQVTSAPGMTERTYVRLDQNGWATREVARPETLKEFERLWTWSGPCAPVRLESIDETALPCDPPARVLVRATNHGKSVAGAVIVWGTRSMIDELPDDFLPRAGTAEDGTAAVDAPAGQVVFARVAGPKDVSAWRELEIRDGRAAISAVAGTDASITVSDDRQQATPRVRVLLFPAGAGDASNNPPTFAAAEKGLLRLRVPALGTSRLVLWNDDQAPLEIIDTNDRLPKNVNLPRGCAVRGTIVGRGAKKIIGAGAVIVFPLPDSGRATRKRTISGAEGRFELRGIRCGVSVLSIGKKSFAPIRRELKVDDGEADLGRIVLIPARSLRVLVTDAASGRPIPGARIRTPDAPVEGKTAPDGIAVVDGLASDDVELEVSAEDYLPSTTHASVATKKPAVVKLNPGATITAHVVRGSDHLPAGPGTLWIDLSGLKKIEQFGSDGRIRIGGLGAGALNAEVRVPGFASHKLPQRDTAAGGKTDFGEIALATGSTISGVVIDAATSVPVAARVRAPRPNPSGPRLSLVMKDWIETTADEKGQFQLRGLNAGEYQLLIEAPGFAPTLTERLTVDRDANETDAGTVTLSRARRLAVSCRPQRRCGSKARLLLGDPNEDWAVLTAPVMAGSAEILTAPAGRHVLQLLDRGALVAEREVVIPDDAMEATVEIVLREITISGAVYRNGQPVTNGSVQFVGRAASSALPIVVDKILDSAVVDSDVVGVLPRTSVAKVDDKGLFSTQELGPGVYTVSYSGPSGVSREQEIAIPDVSSYSFDLQIPATAIRGRIADQEGKVPEWARIEIQIGGSLVSADMMPDGRFSVDGAPSGAASIHAFNDTSEAKRDTVIEPDRETQIDLTLQAKPRRRITLTALASSGNPRAAARLFLLCDGALLSADSDTSGTASFPVPAAAQSCQGAAFSAVDGWAFAGSLSMPSDSEPAPSTVRFSARSVALTVESRNASTLAIAAGNGFPLERTFPFIGWPAIVSPPRPLRLRGLPPGTYVVRLATGFSQVVTIDGTKDATASFK